MPPSCCSGVENGSYRERGPLAPAPLSSSFRKGTTSKGNKAMYTDNDGQDTLPDERTREVIDYCRSIQGKDLEVFPVFDT